MIRRFVRWLLGPPSCRECGLLRCEADDVGCDGILCRWSRWP